MPHAPPSSAPNGVCGGPAAIPSTGRGFTSSIVWLLKSNRPARRRPGRFMQPAMYRLPWTVRSSNWSQCGADHSEMALFHNRSAVTVLFTILLAAVPSIALSQAWVDVVGHGSASASYSYFRGGDHLYSSSVDGQRSRGYEAKGKRWNLGTTYMHTFMLGVDYCALRRLGVSADLSYARGHYQGRAPVNLDVDDGAIHGRLQDASLQVRYMFLARSLAVTPSLGYTFPIMDYPDHGHAALGLGLSRWSIGVSVGRSLSPLARRAYAHGQVIREASEERAGHRMRRVTVDAELGYLLTDDLAFSVTSSFLRSSGGEDWLEAEGAIHGAAPPLGTAFSDSRYTRLGVGAACSIVGPFGVSAAFVSTISGANVEDGDYLILGLNWRFVMPFADSFGES